MRGRAAARPQPLLSPIAPAPLAPHHHRPTLQAIYDRVRELIDAAGVAGVNVLCLQEVWPMPFAFCTREKAWTEFAESAEAGPSTRLCQELARKHNMVGWAHPCGDEMEKRAALCVRRGWRCTVGQLTDRSPSPGPFVSTDCACLQVIVSPILERDEAHGETIWNTAVVRCSRGRWVGRGCLPTVLSADPCCALWPPAGDWQQRQRAG